MPTADYEERVKRILKAVNESDEIPDENAQLLEDYRRDKNLDGISDATLQRNLSYLKILGEWAGDTPFEDLGESELKDFISETMDRDLADATVDTYKKAVRNFYKWLIDEDEPEAVDWVTLSNNGGKDTLPSDLLTKEDVQKQIEAAHNARDKALISMLYETGARIGELIDLTVRDIEDRTHGKKVVIDGKTGARRLPLVESVPYLNKWLNEHPSGGSDDPLWCKIQQGGPEDQLGYRYIREKILKRTMEDAGIDKPSNPHHYRHSRASYMANEMTEAQLCEWFGWVQGSDVPARYVHLSGRDIDNAYDEMHGLVEPEEEDHEEDVIQCPRCQELNEPGSAFCARCGFALDQDSAAELEEEVQSDVQESLAQLDPGDDRIQTLLEISDVIENDPDLKEILLDRKGK